MELDAPKPLEELIRDLASDREELRREAVQQLARSGEGRALEALRQLTNDASVSIRFSARKAVAAIEKRLSAAGEAGAQPQAPSEAPGPGAAGISEWRVRLGSSVPQIRLKAVVDTYDERPRELFEVLLEMTSREADVNVLSALVSALGRYQDSAALPALFAALESVDSRVRANAVDALGRFRNPRVIEQLSRLASDPDNRVQANLARALGQFDPQFLHDQVSAMLSSGTLWMRESALYVLWAVRDDWCKAELDFLANDPAEDSDFRERARRFPPGLMRLSRAIATVPSAQPPPPSPAYEPGFEMAASEADPWGLETTVERPHEVVIPEETEELPAPMAPSNRLASAQGAAQDADQLVGQLSDKSAEVKLAALGNVSRFPDERVWQQVEILAMDKNDAVREKARGLLKDHYGADAVADLSSAAISIQQRAAIDLSTAAMRLARGQGGGVEDVDVTLAASQTGMSRSTRTGKRATRAGRTLTQAAHVPPIRSTAWPPWAIGAVLSAALLVGVAGLVKLALSYDPGGASPTTAGTTSDDSAGGSKLAQIARAKDLGKFIGIAVSFPGKVVDAKHQEARYVIQSGHGNIVVQFVRSLPKPPAVGDQVDVDGVLLGKTRDGSLLLRGRKLTPAQGG